MSSVLHQFVYVGAGATDTSLLSASSALTAAGLAFSPSPLLIAALWVLTSASWAILLPIQRAVVAEFQRASGGPRH